MANNMKIYDPSSKNWKQVKSVKYYDPKAILESTEMLSLDDLNLSARVDGKEDILFTSYIAYPDTGHQTRNISFNFDSKKFGENDILNLYLSTGYNDAMGDFVGQGASAQLYINNQYIEGLSDGGEITYTLNYKDHADAFIEVFLQGGDYTAEAELFIVPKRNIYKPGFVPVKKIKNYDILYGATFGWKDLKTF
jgi:hypothetical protein